jgi:hypothetical protein
MSVHAHNSLAHTHTHTHTHHTHTHTHTDGAAAAQGKQEENKAAHRMGGVDYQPKPRLLNYQPKPVHNQPQPCLLGVLLPLAKVSSAMMMMSFICSFRNKA